MMAERADAFHRAAGRHRHLRRAVRGLDLAPAGLPRQAGRPAQRRRLLRRLLTFMAQPRPRRCVPTRRPAAAWSTTDRLLDRWTRAGSPRPRQPTTAKDSTEARTGPELVRRPLRPSRRCGCAPPVRPAVTKILPSPILPVLAALTMASMQRSTSVVLDHHLDLHLGQEVDHVFGAAVELGVALLAAEALDLGHGQARSRRRRPALRALLRA